MHEIPENVMRLITKPQKAEAYDHDTGRKWCIERMTAEEYIRRIQGA